MRKIGVAFDHALAHLDAQNVGAGNTVIGTVPFYLVAAVCARGAQ